MNDQNLIPLNKRSKKVQREIQEKGRQANKAKHQEKRTIRECMKILAALPCKAGKLKERINEAGIEDEAITNGMAVAFTTMMNATKNPAFARVLFEMLGENDVQGVTKLPPEPIQINFSDKAAEK